MTNFKDQYLSGEVDISKLDDFVENWHKNKNKNNTTLQNYLGFNDEEYVALIRGEIEIKNLLDSQKHWILYLKHLMADIYEIPHPTDLAYGLQPLNNSKNLRYIRYARRI